MIRRTIRAKRDRVFEAWTDPKRMQEWFFPGTWKAKSENDLRIGGFFRNEMIPDPNGPDLRSCDKGDLDKAKGIVHTGEYLEIITPEKLVFTWNSPSVTNTRVTIELKDLGDSTELTLTHELLETEVLRQSHTGGWEGCLANLVTYLE